MKYKLFFILLIAGFQLKSQDSAYYPLRCLGINIGNVGFNCWESKICEQPVVTNLRNYIQSWNPDIIMISEVYKRTQLDSTEFNGPLLPAGYSCDCGKSINRNDSLPAGWDAADASHEHECIAWKTALFTVVPNSSKTVYGRNDSYGLQNCNYDFTGHSVRLLYKGVDTITPVSIHPNSTYPQCRTYEIANYWEELCASPKTVIAGDWNTDIASELQVPTAFKTIFSKGYYWDLHYASGDYSHSTFLGSRHLDHAYANFAEPCTNCGNVYGTGNLQYGAALGGYNNHPRADGGSGMDHRQILFDMNVKCALPEPLIQVAQNGSVYSYSCTAGADESILWDFGNGDTSTSANPVYFDSVESGHVVKLTLTNWCGSNSDSVSINNTGIIANNNSTGIYIYPNPVNSSFVISSINHLSKDKTYWVEMKDIGGKLVLKELVQLNGKGLQEVNINHLPNQLYTVSIAENSRLLFKGKIIKTN